MIIIDQQWKDMQALNIESDPTAPKSRVCRIAPEKMGYSFMDLPEEVVQKTRVLRDAKGKEIDLPSFSKEWHIGNSLIFCKKIRRALDLVEHFNEILLTYQPQPLFTGDECGQWLAIKTDRDPLQSYDAFIRLKDEIIDRISDLPIALQHRLILPKSALKELQDVLALAQSTLHAKACLCGRPKIDHHHFDVPVWLSFADNESRQGVSAVQHYLPIEFFLGKKEGDRITLFHQSKRLRLHLLQRQCFVKNLSYTCSFTAPFEEYLQQYEQRARRLGFLDRRLFVKGQCWTKYYRRLRQYLARVFSKSSSPIHSAY